MTDVAYLEGLIAVEAAIRAGNRPVRTLYLQEGKRSRRLYQLHQVAAAQRIPVEEVTDTFIETRASGRSHGGVMALVEPRRFMTLEALAVGQRPFVVMLDGIEDPFNLGQAIRALYAGGVDGLVLRSRNWLSTAGIVTRASAGASEWMPTALAESAEQAAAFFRQKGLQVACTTSDRATSLYLADLTQPMFLLVGGERRGITRSYLELADVRLSIPYGRHFVHSLGTVAAAAIIAFEVMRQRKLE